MSLYSDYFYSKEINQLLSEPQAVAQMLRFEATLALAQAENGIIPMAAAQIIAQCCKVEYLDLDKLKTEIKLGGNAAIPLVKQLSTLVKSNDVEASKYVHLGATSQDVIDTATVLLLKEYCHWLLAKTDHLLAVLADITQKHRHSIMIGRTLLQQARPITFGLKTAGWLQSIARSKERLQSIQKRVFVIQLGGAVGSGNSNISTAVQHSMAAHLNLQPSFSWQAQRDNLVETASILGLLNQSIGKIARDISLLMQTEIAEVYEGAGEGKGGSSTMPHKRNPVSSAAIIANSLRIPNLVATLFSTMPQEHERSAGYWHAEWEVLTDIMLLTAGSMEKSIELLTDLEVDTKRMLQNIEISKGLIYAENISLALATKIGKINAHELVEKACKTALSQQKHLKETLEKMNVDIPNLEELFKAENSIGDSLEIIDKILLSQSRRDAKN